MVLTNLIFTSGGASATAQGRAEGNLPRWQNSRVPAMCRSQGTFLSLERPQTNFRVSANPRSDVMRNHLSAEFSGSQQGSLPVLEVPEEVGVVVHQPLEVVQVGPVDAVAGPGTLVVN